jgi:hypothetical protein
MVIMAIESAVLVLSGVTLLVEILAGAGGAGESLVEAGVGWLRFFSLGQARCLLEDRGIGLCA